MKPETLLNYHIAKLVGWKDIKYRIVAESKKEELYGTAPRSWSKDKITGCWVLIPEYYRHESYVFRDFTVLFEKHDMKIMSGDKWKVYLYGDGNPFMPEAKQVGSSLAYTICMAFARLYGATHKTLPQKVPHEKESYFYLTP